MSGWVVHERDETLRNYAMPIEKFVVFLLRTEVEMWEVDDLVRLPLSEGAREKAGLLYQALESGVAEIGHIHALLWETLGAADPRTAEDRWLCPVFKCMSNMAIRKDGGFMWASDYPPLCVRMMFGVRAVHFYEAYLVKGRESRSLWE